MMTRRQALKRTALAGVVLATLPNVMAQNASAPPTTPTPDGPFKLPPLPYAYYAMEPYIDARTMQIHHDKHHAAYVANLNKAVVGYPDVAKMSIEDILTNLNAVPEEIRTAVRNQGGGHYNHTLFWQMLKKDTGAPQGALAAAVNQKFGSFNTFKEKWTKSATGVFGSGWTWLVVDGNKQLSIETTPNQDATISSGKQPLLGIDVWEHAYYLKYQNRRPEYVAAFFEVINWDFVSGRYEKFTG
ncbi:MAG TPA: superoxide dismutase [Pseudomonadales bacterium]|nr:superoxide dismutase [Pseudomonadales bacterium]